MLAECHYYDAPQQKSSSAAMIALAAVFGCIGAASLAHIAQTNLYAPVATQPAVASQVVVAPVARMAPRAAPVAAMPAEGVEVDAVEVQGTQATTNPAVFGLLAIPVGLLALAMRRNTPASLNDEEAGHVCHPGCVHAMGAMGAFAAAAQPAMASQQVAEVADGRLGLLAALLLPALGWVGFNILKPALRQLEKMQEKSEGAPVRPRGKR